MMEYLKYTLFLVVVVAYTGLCTYLYLSQEKFIFKPAKLAPREKLIYSIPFEEITIQVKGANLSGAYFKISDSKGLIFFVHGNKGNILDLETQAVFYTQLGYDFFTFDYRGYGKSEGKIKNGKQFFSDVQAVYDYIKNTYGENKITIIGHSLGTCAASKLSLNNNPTKLILIAPYYSMSDMIIRNYKIIPTFLLKYKFNTYKYVKEIKKRILIIHGEQDATLPFEGGEKLAELLNSDGEFFPIKNQGHIDFEENPLFVKKVKEFLSY